MKRRPRDTVDAAGWTAGLLAALLAIGCVPADPGGGTPQAGGPEGPPAEGPRLDRPTALALAAMPLACLDRPHPAPSRTGYLYARTLAMRPDYESTRAFYGCYDWHSAVNSTWALVALLRRDPELPVAPLIVEKLRQHLASDPLAGELEYFEDNPTFERPYGWAWLLALQGELVQFEHPEAAAWATALQPLADRFSAGLVEYLQLLDYPLRVGTHANTAFAIDLAHAYARATDRTELAAALATRARELFGADRDCPLAYEPSASDFLSPCLQEAVTMVSVLSPDEASDWLDGFLPEPDDGSFQRLAAPLRIAAADEELDVGQQGARSHLIGLAFTRAEALSRLASALAPGDPRVAAYRALAAELATWGMESMFDADYLGSHWIGTFATRYLVTLPLHPTQ